MIFNDINGVISLDKVASKLTETCSHIANAKIANIDAKERGSDLLSLFFWEMLF